MWGCFYGRNAIAIPTARGGWRQAVAVRPSSARNTCCLRRSLVPVPDTSASGVVCCHRALRIGRVDRLGHMRPARAGGVR